MRLPALCTLLALFLPPLTATASGPVTLCYDDADNVPWLVKGGRGINNELIDAAARRSGIEVQQIALPWKRCLYQIAKGEISGGFAASYTEERAEFAAYPSLPDGRPDPARRMKTDGYALYRLKGTGARWEGERYLGVRIGAQLGYVVAADLRRLGVEVLEVNGGPEMLKSLLITGRLEMIALMTHEGEALLHDPDVGDKVEAVTSPLVTKPYFTIFNKAYHQGNRETVERFWAAIAAARESPEFRRLVRERTAKPAAK